MESEQFGDGSGARVPDFGPASLLLGEAEFSRVTLTRKRAQTSCVRRDVRTLENVNYGWDGEGESDPTELTLTLKTCVDDI